MLERTELLHLDVPSDEVLSVSGPRPALLVLNDTDLTYAKVRLDETSVETVLRGLSGIPDPLTRAVVWNSLRDMVRDGELDPQDYLTTAEAHLPEENDLAIVQGVITFARTQIAVRYLAPEQRTAALATLTSIARGLLRRTEDGSDPGLRLTAVRTLVDSATQPDTIAAWLADDSVPGGPELDPELRWRILARLSVLGTVDETAIDTALAADPSATGQEGAARCRAALPTPRPRPPPGSASSTTTPCPTTSSAPPPRASGSPNRPTSYGNTCPATTPRQWPSAPAAARPSPKPPAAGPSPSTPSTRPTSSPATPASGTRPSSRSSAAN